LSAASSIRATSASLALALFGLLSLASPEAWADEREGCRGSAGQEAAYFYHGSKNGSESQFGPLTVLINGGFDIVRNPSYSSEVFRLNYGKGLENVARNVSNPRWAMGPGGLSHAIAHEVLPYRGFSSNYGQWLPNVFLHTLGEGMLYRKTTEWYRSRCFESPRVFGFATVFATQVLNEVIENGAYQGPNIDPMADFLLFNILGYTLFSFDSVAGFFSGPVQLNYWPGQAAFDIAQGRIFNQGENYAFQVTLGNWTDWRAFLYFGVDGLLGLSVPLGGTKILSLGMGSHLMQLEEEIFEGTRVLIPQGDLNLAGGLFYENDRSLIASFTASGGERPVAAFNLYPSFLQVGTNKFGAYARAGQDEGYSIGVTASALPLVPGVIFGGSSSAVRF